MPGALLIHPSKLSGKAQQFMTTKEIVSFGSEEFSFNKRTSDKVQINLETTLCVSQIK
jgi:hypothetical protein